MIAAVLLLAGTALAPPPDWNCDDPQVQQEMNWCAAQGFEKADAALNAQWKKAAAAMRARDADQSLPGDDRPGHFATLLEAQRAWIAFRDAQCRSEGYLFRGGSMEPLLVHTCMTRLSEERTQQLRYLIEQ